MGKKRNKAQSSKEIVPKALGPKSREKWINIMAPLAIIVCTSAVFSKVVDHLFVNWDDISYITQNLLIRDFSAAGIAKILTTPVIGMYNPLPFLIYAAEYKFWELNPVPYMLSNVLFHLLAVLALYRFIYRLTGKYETASIVAVLFACHPMHVEVVAWASETKTSLFVIFYFLALGEYLKYVSDGYKPRYLFYATILFIISALSKPEGVTLAPMLVLLDYYLGRKWDGRLLLEKIPFFIIGLFFGILTFYTHIQADDDIFQISRNYSFINNLLVSNYSIAFYIEKLLFPIGLCAIYPYPDNTTWLPVQYYLALPVIPFIAWLVYKSGKFRKEMIFGVLFFLISISVLLRLVPSGFFGIANRYSYLSYTGFFFIMGQFYVYIKEGKLGYASGYKKYMQVSLGIYIAFCLFRCNKRIDVWQNSVTLFTDVINMQPKFAIGYDMRSSAKYQFGDMAGAIQDVSKAIELDSTCVRSYNNRTAYKWLVKDYDGAFRDCAKALSLDAYSVAAYVNRSSLNASLGRWHEAMTDDSICIKLNPKEAGAYYNMALVKMALYDTASAVVYMKTADELGYPRDRNFLFVSK